MELVYENRRAYYEPVSERQSRNCVINSFQRWETAFRIFSNIFTSKFPERAVELTQYSHIIHSAAQTFTWSNVYAYDRDFRIHMSSFPQHNWGIILSHAWLLRLKDRLTMRTSIGNGQEDRKPVSRRDICWKFNLGRCTYGMSCKFEHKCALCGKFGHGTHNCRRARRGGKFRKR